MAIANLTEDYVRKLKVPEGKKDWPVFDEKLRGFGVRKYANGHIVYFVKYSINGKPKKQRLGPYVVGNLKAMRLEASEVLTKARQGIDVFAVKKAEAEAAASLKTLGELVPIYLEVREKGDAFWRKMRPKSLSGATHYLKDSWAPLHGVPVEQITRQQVNSRRDEIVTESGAVSANRALAALSVFFRWAIDKDHYKGAINPTRDIPPLPENKRGRVLCIEAELPVILQAADAIGGDFGAIVWLLALTGCRRQEIGGLEWSEINWDKRQLDLPGHKVKNGKPHIVPLSEPALAILKGFMHEGWEGRRYVFDAGAGFASRWWGKDQLDKRIEARLGKPLPHWILHDLRRSFVTHISELGYAPPHVIESLVNHVSGSKAGVAGVYNRAVYLPERRKALEDWGRHLTEHTRPFAVPASQNEATEHPTNSAAISSSAARRCDHDARYLGCQRYGWPRAWNCRRSPIGVKERHPREFRRNQQPARQRNKSMIRRRATLVAQRIPSGFGGTSDVSAGQVACLFLTPIAVLACAALLRCSRCVEARTPR